MTLNAEPERFLTVPEIAERTHLSVDTIRWYRHTGAGPRTFRLGRRVFAKESDVEAWIEAQYAADRPTPAA